MIIIDYFKFDDGFTSLGSALAHGNEVWTDIHPKIMPANHMYSPNNKLFNPKLLSWNTVLQIYKTLI
jgi:hypothetical protein